MKYILIDTFNTAFRAKHVTGVASRDGELKAALSLHILLSSLNKVRKRFDCEDVVFFFEGKSWRKEIYPRYKRNRVEKLDERSQDQIDEDEDFIRTIYDFEDFVLNKTNAYALKNKILEADDLISFWIDAHPDDEHIIISSDSDFVQLLAPNVSIYNGVSDIYTTLEGQFDEKGKKVKETPEPGYSLFLKCIRGDKSDNIMPSYPRVREKGTKNKVGILEAYQDKDKQTYNYVNFMNQVWTDENEETRLVRDEYERNRLLIDLKAQPDDIKLSGYKTIQEALEKEKLSAPDVGFAFIKFCQRYELDRIAKQADTFIKLFR